MDKPLPPHKWGLLTTANSAVGSHLNRHALSNLDRAQGKRLRPFGYLWVGTSA